VRGREIAMIFQEPMSSLSPVHTIGDQITEVLRLHLRLNKRDARARAVDLLRAVEISNPEAALDRYAFEFSGGMRQRAMIAMALACDPAVLIADEPTTALDVTTQAEILDLIKRLQVDRGMAVMFITHDMGVVAEVADEVVVMNRGAVVERGTVERIFTAPAEPYTRHLIGNVLKLEQPSAIRAARPPMTFDAPPVLEVRDVAVHFGRAQAHVRAPPPSSKAVDGIRLILVPGRTLGVVGESGLGQDHPRALHPPHGGPHRGRDRLPPPRRHHRGPRRRRPRDAAPGAPRDPHDLPGPLRLAQPAHDVNQIVGEPLLVNGLASGVALRDRVAALLERVGLDRSWGERFPHAFSGGQRQRIGIARALALNPRIIIADEPTSALDVSLRAQMLDLLLTLQDELSLAFMFISHDISVIRYMCDEVAVMYRGRVVETGPTEQVCDRPNHAYTRALLSAVPAPRSRDEAPAPAGALRGLSPLARAGARYGASPKHRPRLPPASRAVVLPRGCARPRESRAPRCSPRAGRGPAGRCPPAPSAPRPPRAPAPRT
jgi:peptide/nickel transport system ATP-binding protein